MSGNRVSVCGKGDGSKFDVAWAWEGKGRDPYRGNDATKDKTETMYVGIMVGVVLHGRWGGVVRDNL